MAQAQSLPLLSQYSDVFTRLHAGRHACAHYGMNRVVLNRFIVDSAESTTPQDPNELISMVDPDKIEGDGTPEQKLEQCKTELLELVALQEEVNTLQKVAREKGIAGGLLNIVGQASIQSPADHGASVIHQLSVLMGGTVKSEPGEQATPASIEESEVVDAANDDMDKLALPAESLPGKLNAMVVLLNDNWQMIAVDVAVCFAASIFAIGLVS